MTTGPGAGGSASLAPADSRPAQVTRLTAPGRPDLDVTATPARHGPPLSRPIVGDVVGFAVRRAGQDEVLLWITGDTVLYGRLRGPRQEMSVDVALVHVGGVRFPITGPVRYTMTGRQAVELIGLVRPRVAVPVHYEGWSHFKDGRARIEDALAEAPPATRGLRPMAHARVSHRRRLGLG